MKRICIIATLTCLGLSQTLQAASIREIGPTELRHAVTSGQTVGLVEVFDTIKANFDGEPVEFRAFDAGNAYYRVLLMSADGRVQSIVIDAENGDIVPSNTLISRELSRAVTTSSVLPTSASATMTGRSIPSRAAAMSTGN
jgi:hypothetical protein